MESQLLLISENASDQAFWTEVANDSQFSLVQMTDPARISRFLEEHREVVVLWDTSTEEGRAFETLIKDKASPSRVFAIAEAPINQHPDLFKPPAFAHQLYRRYAPPAGLLYPRLIRHLKPESRISVKDLLPSISSESEMTLTHTAQKREALDTISRFLEDQGVSRRLVSAGTDALDELIMNAIFDAPWNAEEGHFRRKLPRDAQYELPKQEQVHLTAVVGPDVVGIQVTDQFGSVDREKIISKLACNYETESYDAPSDDPGAGLGLYRINQSAITLVFVIEPGVKTHAILLIGNKPSIREVKLGFCFFSVILNR